MDIVAKFMKLYERNDGESVKKYIKSIWKSPVFEWIPIEGIFGVSRVKFVFIDDSELETSGDLASFISYKRNGEIVSLSDAERTVMLWVAQEAVWV